MRDPTGVSKGSGFVAFSTAEEASRAVSCRCVLFDVNIVLMVHLSPVFFLSVVGDEWKDAC